MSSAPHHNPPPPPRLALDEVCASYGGPDIVHGVSLSVRPGQALTLLGPNGAGKTTLLRAICGLVGRTGGTVTVDGMPVQHLPPHKIIRTGVAHVPQGRNLFPYMTGLENLRIGGHYRTDRDELERDIERFVGVSPVVARVANRPASLMSGGEQQIIAVGRAMMSRPRILLLDEPSLGLAPVLVSWVFEIVTNLMQDLGEAGVALILVEQNVRIALDIAQEVAVLVAGSIVHQGPTAELDPDAILDLYMGRGTSDPSTPARCTLEED